MKVQTGGVCGYDAALAISGIGGVCGSFFFRISHKPLAIYLEE